MFCSKIDHCVTVCPKSFGPFYKVSYYINWSRLLGHMVSTMQMTRLTIVKYDSIVQLNNTIALCTVCPGSSDPT